MHTVACIAKIPLHASGNMLHDVLSCIADTCRRREASDGPPPRSMSQATLLIADMDGLMGAKWRFDDVAETRSQGGIVMGSIIVTHDL